MEQEIKIQLLVEQIAVLDDGKAFEKLFHVYYKRLLRFADAIVKDAQSAEEVVSDVFLNLWRNRSKLLEIENLNSYLYVATKNLAIRSRTRLQHRTPLNIEEIEIEPEHVTNPEEILLNNELVKRYEAAVSRLPARCQTIYRLARQDGLRYKEIAAILNVSVKTVDAQMAIALKRITQVVRFVYDEKRL
ncbi:MAG: RNA polymerase sigma-70 factor [Niabella sp.]|nr:RNA polymerase sigma-70 factor [Niabella sp.]